MERTKSSEFDMDPRTSPSAGGRANRRFVQLSGVVTIKQPSRGMTDGRGGRAPLQTVSSSSWWLSTYEIGTHAARAVDQSASRIYALTDPHPFALQPPLECVRDVSRQDIRRPDSESAVLERDPAASTPR